MRKILKPETRSDSINFIRFWLNSIALYARSSTDNGKEESGKGSPIFLIGSHKDVVPEVEEHKNISDILTRTFGANIERQNIQRNEKEGICFFPMDNTAENADPVPVPPTAPAPSPTTTSYFEKIVRHIPATINAAYVASLGLLAENAPNPAWLHWSVFLVLLILVPFYVLYIPGQFQDKSMSKRYCVFASTISFIVWVYAIDGGPIAISFPQLYQPLYGSLLLIITTLVLPVLEIVLQKLNYFRPENEET